MIDKIINTTLNQQDKGHLQELIEFYDTLTGKTNDLPIHLDDMIKTSEVTLLI